MVKGYWAHSIVFGTDIHFPNFDPSEKMAMMLFGLLHAVLWVVAIGLDISISSDIFVIPNQTTLHAGSSIANIVYWQTVAMILFVVCLVVSLIGEYAANNSSNDVKTTDGVLGFLLRLVKSTFVASVLLNITFVLYQVSFFVFPPKTHTHTSVWLTITLSLSCSVGDSNSTP